MLYWDLIEEFLPDFEERDDVKFDTVLFRSRRQSTGGGFAGITGTCKKRLAGGSFFCYGKASFK